MQTVKFYKQIISLQKTIILLQGEKCALMNENDSLERQRTLMAVMMEKGIEAMGGYAERCKGCSGDDKCKGCRGCEDCEIGICEECQEYIDCKMELHQRCIDKLDTECGYTK